MKRLHARRHRAGRGDAAPPASRSPTSPGAPVRAVATSAVREAENHDEFVRAGPRAGGRRGRGDLGRRGGPPHPPRRPAGAAGVRPPAAPVRHRRRQHRAAHRRAGRGRWRRGASSSAPSGSPHRFFPGDHLHPSAVSSCRAFVRSTLSAFAREVEPTASRWRSARRARSRPWRPWPGPPRRRAAADVQRPPHLRADDLVGIVQGARRRPIGRSAGRLPGLDAGPRRHHPGRRPHPRGRLRRLRRRRARGVATTPCARACCSTPSSAPTAAPSTTCGTSPGAASCTWPSCATRSPSTRPTSPGSPSSCSTA